MQPPATAYPQDPNNCNDTTLHWGFDSDPLWTADNVDRQQWVRSAINALDNALSYNGNQLISVDEDGGISVQIKDKPAGEYGSSECDAGASIWVNSNYTTGRFYWQVGRHEMFHLAGAEHGGNDDSHNTDDPPTMATCINQSTFNSVNGLWQDDAAYETWLHDGLANRQLNANLGFEQGSSFWAVTGGATTYRTTGGATGPGYFIWDSPGASDYWYQTVTVHTGDDNETYRSVGNAKELDSQYKTYAQASLYRRTVTDGANGNGCSYPDGIDDPNDYSVSGGWIALAESSPGTQVGTSWESVASSWADPATVDGFEFQIRMYGYSIDGSGVTHAFGIDNVRGEGT